MCDAIAFDVFDMLSRNFIFRIKKFQVLKELKLFKKGNDSN